MAFDFSKLNFFSKLDARSRVFVIFGGLIGFGLMVYFAVAYFSSGTAASGPSNVVGAPVNLTSKPGGQTSPLYRQTLQQANQVSGQRAASTGGSSISTLINPGQVNDTMMSGGGTTDCTILCDEDAVDVGNTIENWIAKGNLKADVGKQLEDLAASNASVEDFAATLAQLVKEGKITPQQARTLLEEYTKQHKARQLAESSKVMDNYIKNGELSLDAANQLLELQRNNATPADYKAKLQELVQQGKLSQATANRLAQQYIQMRAKNIVQRSIASLKALVANNQLSQDIATVLIGLEEKMVSVDEYEARLNTYRNSGKIAPIIADGILAEFRQQKADIGALTSIETILKTAEKQAYKDLKDLQQAGKVTSDAAAEISNMMDKNVPMSEFQKRIAELVDEKKISPDAAQLLLSDYKKVKDQRSLADQLNDMQANNKSCEEQAAILKQAVAANVITPDDAAQMNGECAANKVAPATAGTTGPSGGPQSDFDKIKQRLEDAKAQDQADEQKKLANAAAGESPVGSVPGGTEAFTEAQRQAAAEAQQARQAKIQNIASSMSGQVSQLLSAWAAPEMLHRQGSPDDDKTKGKGGASSSSSSSSSSTSTTTPGAAETPPLIKAGSIIFAVLDTAVNSDYPDSPVLATVVEGKFKGAKLLGKLVTTKGVSGQMDRVTLNFTIMNMDAWTKSKTTTAYAIDPDTAKTVLASEVDYHYMQRFGALMATSFLSGYGNAVTSSGGSTTQSAFGTSTQNATLSPSNKLAAAIGEMAKAVGQATKKYTERPPTVTIDSGVGLGILFMADVT